MKGEMIMNDTRNLDNEIEAVRKVMETILDSEDYQFGRLYAIFNLWVNLSPEKILQASSLEELYVELEKKEAMEQILEEICKAKESYWTRLREEREFYDGCSTVNFTPKKIRNAESLQELQRIAKEKVREQEWLKLAEAMFLEGEAISKRKKSLE